MPKCIKTLIGQAFLHEESPCTSKVIEEPDNQGFISQKQKSCSFFKPLAFIIGDIPASNVCNLNLLHG